ncbi:MAG: helix-turn-helix transcriptional regulator [Bacteroidota bacterium]|nr:helix-turn-helix transcriptional regulator [Bacteroidota bacterium]
MDEKERIEKIMLKEEMNSAVFAAEIGIQGSTLSHILNGRNNPSLDVLKKILNRFRTVSSDWLILGVGSMYRTEKQSQALTLFDSLDETDLKPSISQPNLFEKNVPTYTPIQQKTVPVQEIPVPTPQETPPATFIPPSIEPTSKSVRKIIVYYSDNTFQEFK